MKKLIYSFMLIFLANFSIGQEWNSTSPNTIYAENGANQLNPVFVGIGTDSPVRQLHTTGQVRFTGLPTSATIPNFVVGAQSDGDLVRFSADLLGNNNAWLLNGNNNVSNQNFIGTINNQSFRIRTNNTQRMIVTNAGRVGINSTAPLFQFETRYQSTNAYTADIDNNGNWNNSDGIFLYNNQAANNNTSNRFSSITLGSISGGNLSISKINSVATSRGESALTFQTENTPGGSDVIRERMRITHDGTVEINIQQNTDNNLALHTDGNLQFDNLPQGGGNYLVIDPTTNRVRMSTNVINSFTGGSNKYVQELEDRLEKLEQQVKVLASLNNNSFEGNLTSQPSKVALSQNVPNPTSESTRVNYSIDMDFNDAQLLLYNISGQLVKTFSISNESGSIEIDTYQLENGTYIYSLEVDGNILESKKLIKKSRF